MKLNQKTKNVIKVVQRVLKEYFMFAGVLNFSLFGAMLIQAMSDPNYFVMTKETTSYMSGNLREASLSMLLGIKIISLMMLLFPILMVALVEFKNYLDRKGQKYSA